MFTLGDREGKDFLSLFHGSSNDLSLMYMGVKMYCGIKNSFEADVFAVFLHAYVAYLFSKKIVCSLSTFTYSPSKRTQTLK